MIAFAITIEMTIQRFLTENPSKGSDFPLVQD